MSQTPQLFCPNCKGGNSPTALQCQWCSAPLQVQQAAQIFCSNCGGGNPPAALHCMWCKAAIQKQVFQQTPVVASKKSRVWVVWAIGGLLVIWLLVDSAVKKQISSIPTVAIAPSPFQHTTVPTAALPTPRLSVLVATNTVAVVAIVPETNTVLPPTKSPVPTAIATEIPTEVPTEPLPPGVLTAIARGPEPTQVPATQVPTQTPVRAWSDAEQTYINQVVKWSTNYSQAFRTITELSSAPDLTSDNWKFQMVLALATIQSLDKEVQAYKPPKRFSAVHAKLVSASRHYESSTTLLANGIDKSSKSLITQAGSEMDRGTKLIAEAAQALQGMEP